MEDKQTRVELCLIGCWHVRDIIYCLIDRSIGIEVAAKLHTDRLAIADNAIAWEILCTVKAHVLEEVSQTSLAVFFLNGAHTLCDEELSAVFWPVVITDIISKSVVKFADTHILVYWYRWHHLRTCSDECCDENRKHQKELFSFHCS